MKKDQPKNTGKTDPKLGESCLNSEQIEAATHMDGPAVVFAGAGSGKTRVIAHRIAYLIDKKVPANRIFAVTFTNKAALELRQRIENISKYGRFCLVSTFHSACVRFLRELASHLGFTSDFTIYDDEDSKTALKAVLKDFSDKLSKEDLPVFRQALSKVKTLGYIPNEIHENGLEHQFPVGFSQVYSRYQEYLASCNAMDFGDLLMNTLLLLRENEQVRKKLQSRFDYILVDEYQDTNTVQFEFLSYLSDQHKNLFVVGDDDQSIYSWRGAKPSHIINFEQFYPDAKRYLLSQNYRSTNNIIEAANGLISFNKYRASKKLWTDSEKGEKIRFLREADSQIEALQICDQIKQNLDVKPLKDTAIFYRTNSQSREIEESLTMQNIPYKLYGSLRFYERAEIKDIIGYLRILVNRNDNVSLRRIINVPPRSIGKQSLGLLEEQATIDHCSTYQALLNYVLNEKSRAAAKLKHFIDLLEKLDSFLKSNPLVEVIDFIVQTTGYFEYVKKKFPEKAEDKVQNIHELKNALANYLRQNESGNLSDWLQSITLMTNEGEQQATGHVTLMTLHMAKGLEFDYVYITGLEQGILPHANALNAPNLDESIEEERRLLYVGMTRAKKELQLSCAEVRRLYGQLIYQQPSQFIQEIPSNTIEMNTPNLPPGSQSEDEMELQYDFSDGTTPPTTGNRVSHFTYGKGTIEKIVNEWGESKAIVNFDRFGKRKVHTQHLE